MKIGCYAVLSGELRVTSMSAANSANIYKSWNTHCITVKVYGTQTQRKPRLLDNRQK